MKHISRIFAAAAVSLAAALPAYAETTLTVHYPMPGFFKNVMDTLCAGADSARSRSARLANATVGDARRKAPTRVMPATVPRRRE